MNIHDNGYKILFSNKTIFRQLLETFVGEEWVKELDFDKCERLDKSFISDHYKETESDLIYKIKLKQKDIFVVVLIEFQSTVAWFISLRILNYITNFYMDYVNSNRQAKKLPAVFPILLYNGNEKWTAPSKLGDLIEGNELLGKYALNFEYFKIAENEYNRELLLRVGNVVSTLFLAEAHYDPKLLEQELLRVFDQEEDKTAISLFLNWFLQLKEHGRLSAEDFAGIKNAYQSKEEVRTMLITALEKEKKDLAKQIKKELGDELYKKGKFEEQKETAKKMLLRGFEATVVAELTGLPEDEIHKLKTAIANC